MHRQTTTGTLSYGVMVTQQILVLLFQVRILVAQQSPQPRGIQQGEGTKCQTEAREINDARIKLISLAFVYSLAAIRLVVCPRHHRLKRVRSSRNNRRAAQFKIQNLAFKIQNGFWAFLRLVF